MRGLFRDLDAAGEKLVGLAAAVGATKVVEVEMVLRRNSNDIAHGGRAVVAVAGVGDGGCDAGRELVELFEGGDEGFAGEVAAGAFEAFDEDAHGGDRGQLRCDLVGREGVAGGEGVQAGAGFAGDVAGESGGGDEDGDGRFECFRGHWSTGEEDARFPLAEGVEDGLCVDTGADEEQQVVLATLRILRRVQ